MVIKMTYQSKAVRLSEKLLEDIQKGLIREDTVLRTGQLMDRYGVSRPTVRRALNILARRNAVVRHSPRGLRVPRVEGETGESQGATAATNVTLAAMWATPVRDYAMFKRFEGIRKYAESNGLRFTHFHSPRHEDILDALHRIEDYSVNGVIVYPFAADERYAEILTGLHQRRFPLVLARSCRDLPISTVMSDDAVGEYQAAHYLIDKYRRPAYYFGTREGLVESPERYEGYCSAMKDSGFADRIERYTVFLDVREDDPPYWGPEKTYRPHRAAVERALRRIDYPASVLSQNDAGAPDIYDVAEKVGRVVGKDLFIVGFDDLPLAKLLKPPLTTIHAQIEELGFDAGRLLHRIISGQVRLPVHICLPLKLVIRESA
jgi:DNA-binding LacI/PurR family transcriptional regulator